MSGIRRKNFSPYERVVLYQKVLEDIRDNYICDIAFGPGRREHELNCRKCKAEMALEDKDPWYEDIQTFHLDELPAGRYIAYVNGYNDKGTVGFELQPKGEKIDLSKHVPFKKGSVTVHAETTVKPIHPKKGSIMGGDILEIEIVEPEGYKVLRKLNRYSATCS
jgi:hypothetical protein